LVEISDCNLGSLRLIAWNKLRFLSAFRLLVVALTVRTLTLRLGFNLKRSQSYELALELGHAFSAGLHAL